MIYELNETDFESETRGGNVVVLFYSKSRGKDPGGLLEPVAGHRYSDEVKVAMVDVDLHSDIALRYGATVFPAALFLRNGVVKNLIQVVEDPETLIRAAEENACYKCSITRKRTEARKTRRFRR